MNHNARRVRINIHAREETKRLANLAGWASKNLAPGSYTIDWGIRVAEPWFGTDAEYQALEAAGLIEPRRLYYRTDPPQNHEPSKTTWTIGAWFTQVWEALSTGLVVRTILTLAILAAAIGLLILIGYVPDMAIAFLLGLPVGAFSALGIIGVWTR